MDHERLWHCIKAVASAVGDIHQWNDDTLDYLQAEVKRMGEAERNSLRADFRAVIGGLSRLEMRLASEFG